ncbi:MULTISPECIES: carboxylesterase/lipase family protein [Mycobacteriaceae]|jgi:para-nitrobenzyl esterase|uniref:Carboxylic ester hydrolase n=10 Tax=Mycobacteriaceae TaxID=1762 RepID=A0A4V3A6H5_9MYCO|nr:MULTISPECIES: carboxylesterase/lipase family protein [Mycobacteriaceae]MBI3212741.1 carboxylesterase/lipase family protein [Mycobacterium sp.]ANE78902.1 carboxylesterase [Mycobacterium adipatum]MCV7002595.1 carboxylesterase/lipase family protein [Mycolicibacterium alvei]MCV7045968.1 carboxylesterase/lipase family protein [Mycolicibacterium frederiksbergense]MCV7058011.1 carboxylesterase/lipase family protein [Mycolicibacterium gilvum]
MPAKTVRTELTSGAIEGFTRDGVNRWRSIPYAKPPVGALRFKAPQPVEAWDGVRPCHRFRYCAPQPRRYTIVGPGKFQPMSEDCLTLNVVAPDGGSDRPLPVMFFIHGGAYFLGSSATPIYDGASLARSGCVYVSANYRLGALGAVDLSSLSTADIHIDDNLYLRDLVSALRWVRENIAAFGGDPDNVTIFGESAGAHAVTTLLAVPAAKGLFAQAISQSPAGALSRSQELAAEFAAKFASILCADEREPARLLLAARPAQLVNAFDRLLTTSASDLAGGYPVGCTFGTDYLPSEPIQAMRDGKAYRVPLIVGTNADEGRLFTRFLKLLPTNEAKIEALLAGAEPTCRERITAAYPEYPAPDACIRLGADFTFGSTLWQLADSHSRHAPTYLYRYDFAPRTLQWAGLGATHATELLAVFDAYRTPLGRLLSAGADRRSALRVSDDMQGRWDAFARTGVPGDGWPRYTSDARPVLVFDRASRVDNDPHADRRKAWEGFQVLGR